MRRILRRSAGGHYCRRLPLDHAPGGSTATTAPCALGRITTNVIESAFAARGLSANVVSRLKRVWGEEYREWCRRPLDDEWVYLWADGIYSGLRGDDGRLCVLVVMGVNAPQPALLDAQDR